MSFYFRDSPRFADRLRDMSDDELLREMKQRFSEDNGNAFFESGRPTRGDTFERPFSHLPRGFPFNDEADVFERPRGDSIRAHLDDLAARHPEFAEHLRGPPWPFGGSLLRDRRRRRRGSGGSNNDDQQQGQQHQDEDARSQASGSSAASGASAVSSHSSGGGEHDLTSSSAIPQYGLRNTVDIGQQQRRRDMETSPEKDERGQRSMSAPPESWQQQQSQQQGQDQQPPQSGQGQRFVSRVDITPQHNQQRAQSPSKPASNVRHIPIFVEGRDVPVMPKIATDDVPSSTFQHHHQRQTSPPSHHFERSSPPAHHFHRPSHFNERFSRQQWPPSHFQDAFYKQSGFGEPMRRQFQQQQPQYYQQPQHHQQQPQYQQSQYYQQPQQQHEQHHQQQQSQPESQEQQQQQQQQEQETPKPKPPVPKDPLEKVAQVQKEVDDLAEQVRRFVGGSRQDKDYMYLDEMLTRELIKLDDIETEGRENVRQARKNAIKSIQDTISLLETKAPIINQQVQSTVPEREVSECEQQSKEISQVLEPMEIDAKHNEPIPLPPVPSSPTKMKVESSESESTSMVAESADQSIVPPSQQHTEQKTENLAAENIKEPVAPSTDESKKCADETSKASKTSAGKDGKEQKDDDESRTMSEDKHTTSKQQTKEATEGKTEANDGLSSIESPKLQKKTKKTKKKKEQQQPVSEHAIPLPPPPTESAK